MDYDILNIDYIWRINDLDVYYTNDTNGGGDYFLPEYASIVKEWYGQVDNMLEWCSGPGFIGYGMLATGLCKNISFSEIFKPAISMLNKTAIENNLSVDIFTDDTLDNVDKQFDLVVGNPPHWGNVADAKHSLQKFGNYAPINDRLLQVLVDDGWKTHLSFFQNMKKLLKKDGKILLQENNTGSNPELFSQLIKDTGLKILSTAQSVEYKPLNIYYLEVGHA